MRDPLEGFKLGYFAAGWLVALELPRLARLRERLGALAPALCLAGVAQGWPCFARLSPVSLGAFDRVVYTFSVIGLVALATRDRVAGPALRFLGDASLGSYLYHRIFQLLAQPFTDPWPTGARIAAQVAVGLAGALLLLWAGRRLLGGERARRWLGA